MFDSFALCFAVLYHVWQFCSFVWCFAVFHCVVKFCIVFHSFLLCFRVLHCVCCFVWCREESIWRSWVSFFPRVFFKIYLYLNYYFLFWKYNNTVRKCRMLYLFISWLKSSLSATDQNYVMDYSFLHMDLYSTSSLLP